MSPRRWRSEPACPQSTLRVEETGLEDSVSNREQLARGVNKASSIRQNASSFSGCVERYHMQAGARLCVLPT